MISFCFNHQRLGLLIIFICCITAPITATSKNCSKKKNKILPNGTSIATTTPVSILTLVLLIAPVSLSKTPLQDLQPECWMPPHVSIMPMPNGGVTITFSLLE